MPNDKKPPIGFGRERFLDPNGTGDGFLWRGGDAKPEPEGETPPEKPKRQAVIVPVFVGDIEAQEIMEAYDIFPLTPLGRTEHQLIQIIAALEQEVQKYKREADL